jgi:hypothetical protein
MLYSWKFYLSFTYVTYGEILGSRLDEISGELRILHYKETEICTAHLVNEQNICKENSCENVNWTELGQNCFS